MADLSITGASINFTGNIGVNTSSPAGALDVFGALYVGDSSATLSHNQIVVRNYPSTTSRDFEIGNGNWWATPVPYLQPTDNTGLGLDLMPKGSTPQDCWIDLCSTDITLDSINYESLSFKKTASGNFFFGAGANGTGIVRDLQIQPFGGNLSIGANITPLNRLDVGGAVAIGFYAGAYTAPSNGLLVSGNVGIGTPSALAVNLAIAGTGTNILVNNNASEQILSFSGGTLALGGNIAGANGVLQLGGSSSFFVLTGIVSSGNATINSANNVGGVLDIQSQGTTAIRIAAGGESIGIGGVRLQP